MIRHDTDQHFRSPRFRLSTARDHIASVERIAHGYTDGIQFKLATERHTDGVNIVHMFEATRKFPSGLERETIAAFEALRACLDQATFAAALCAGKAKSRKAAFPIANSAEIFPRVLRQDKSSDIPGPILEYIETCKPYRGGNDLIWALNEISVGTKHHLLIPVVAKDHSLIISDFTADGFVKELMLPGDWDPMKRRFTFCVAAPDCTVRARMQASAKVVFGEIDGLAGLDPVQTLKSMATEVEKIITWIMLRCRYILREA